MFRNHHRHLHRRRQRRSRQHDKSMIVDTIRQHSTVDTLGNMYNRDRPIIPRSLNINP
jgi:hypothetical protein